MRREKPRTRELSLFIYITWCAWRHTRPRFSKQNKRSTTNTQTVKQLSNFVQQTSSRLHFGFKYNWKIEMSQPKGKSKDAGKGKGRQKVRGDKEVVIVKKIPESQAFDRNFVEDLLDPLGFKIFEVSQQAIIVKIICCWKVACLIFAHGYVSFLFFVWKTPFLNRKIPLERLLELCKIQIKNANRRTSCSKAIYSFNGSKISETFNVVPFHVVTVHGITLKNEKIQVLSVMPWTVTTWNGTTFNVSEILDPLKE